VRNDVPTVARRNLVGIFGHGTETVGDYAEKVSQRSIAQAIGVVRRWILKSALHHHTLAVAGTRMAGSAIDVKALLSALHNILIHWKGHVISRLVANHAGIKICVFMQLSAGHGAFHGLARRAHIRIKIALSQRLEAGLVVHILTASDKRENREQEQRRKFTKVPHRL